MGAAAAADVVVIGDSSTLGSGFSELVVASNRELEASATELA